MSFHVNYADLTLYLLAGTFFVIGFGVVLASIRPRRDRKPGDARVSGIVRPR